MNKKVKTYHMKTVLLFLITSISVAYSQSSQEYLQSQNNLIYSEKEAFQNVVTTQSGSAASGNFKVTYYRCEWQVDPSVRYINGKVTSYFIITSPTSTISYDLTDSLLVDSIQQNNAILPFDHSGNLLTIHFGSSMKYLSLDSVSIYYHGIPPNTGFGSFVTSTHSGAPILWTLSEPYGSRDWWPCRNGLDDKADSIDVIITNPVAYRAASNGLRQSETISGANKTAHWRHRYPIATYLVCMAVSNYIELDDSVLVGNVSLPMQTFCYPESLVPFQTRTPLVLGTLQYYSQLFGQYPFIKEKYGQVQFGWGGGQEHQTSSFIVSTNENLMAHELAHHWFGDKITCGSWQDIWLNEGFATHLAIMDFEVRYPQSVMATRKKEIYSITALPGGSVWVNDTTDVNRIFDARLTYTKGSHLLYMLRWILGDSLFLKGMRRYFNDSSIAFGFARTADYIRNMEAATGTDLTQFFNDWYYGQGYPSYDVQWTQLDDNYVKIRMKQATSDPSVAFFQLPVALEFKNSTQQKTIVLNNTFNGQVFVNNIGFVADTVVIDPEYWLITANNISEKISDNTTALNQVQVFPNPFSNTFYLFLHNFTATSVGLQIRDSKGSLLFKQALSVNGALYKEVDVPALPKGIYFLRLQTANGFSYVKKILKQ